MNRKLKILIITDETWNDIQHGNNIMTNWFEGMDIELANVYCSSGHPYNNCCDKYFQITDKMMMKSLFSNRKAGNTVEKVLEYSLSDEEEIPFYSFLKSITGDFLRLCRELLWIFGRYDELALKKFIENFKPDVVFSIRYATMKILKLEKVIMKDTKAKFIAFTGDDEYTLQQIKFSPFYWIRRFAVRKMLRSNICFYTFYYMLSTKQAELYHKIFGVETGVIYKCARYQENTINKKLNNPIKLIYVGKLYCNRWKTLSMIAKVIKKINQKEKRYELHIYTQDNITKEMRKALNDGNNSCIKGAIAPNKIAKLYNEYDIALHVESFDLKNRLLTRFSFSTKIVDLLISGCAVMAVCWDQQTGYEFLKDNDIAICASNEQEIYDSLQLLTADVIVNYKEKALKYVKNNLTKEEFQERFLHDLKQMI